MTIASSGNGAAHLVRSQQGQQGEQGYQSDHRRSRTRFGAQKVGRLQGSVCTWRGQFIFFERSRAFCNSCFLPIEILFTKSPTHAQAVSKRRQLAIVTRYLLLLRWRQREQLVSEALFSILIVVVSALSLLRVAARIEAPALAGERVRFHRGIDRFSTETLSDLISDRPLKRLLVAPNSKHIRSLIERTLSLLAYLNAPFNASEVRVNYYPSIAKAEAEYIEPINETDRGW